jgi:nucleotide-binding universal stress UspA family protein
MTLDRIMVCWDASRAAARAVADALPFLKKAKQVDIVIVSDKPSSKDEIPGADLGQHLVRHSLEVEIKYIVSPEVDVPSTILSHAADFAADMIVMGGYGHSRLREFVLGGVTRSMLKSMTVPVLMSH